MACADEGCISINWEIKNFNNFLVPAAKKGDRLCSPLWKVEQTDGMYTWCRLYANSSEFLIKFTLISYKTLLPFDLLKSIKMSLVSSRGEVPLQRDGLYYSIEKDVVFGVDRQSILPNHTLTLLCRIGGNSKRNKGYRARFSSVLHNVSHLWKIEKFASIADYVTIIEHDNFLLEVSLEQSKKGTCKCIGQVINATRWVSFVGFSFSIEGGDVCVEDKCFYPYVKWKCNFKIVLENTGINLNIHSIVALHKICQDPKLYSSSEIAKPKNVSEAVFESSGALVDDLLVLYREGALSDATLNTELKSFSAHRSILAARSPVFRAMFEKDEMSEGRSGVVDIDDVDSETVGRMLVFLYGDSLEDMQWEEAASLFYAADKYAVQPLKQKCADILKTGLALDNVCDALVLADTHSDDHLMKLAVDFIYDHQEVVSSKKWEELEERKPRLIIKITKKLFFKRENK